MRMSGNLGADGEARLCGADESATSLGGMKKPLVLLLAGGALAVGVPTALAQTGGEPTPTPAPRQSAPQAQPAPDHPCPKDGGGNGNSSRSL
jgi:hypothetical protein